MCDMSIIWRGSRWFLIDWDALELGQYASETEALAAARRRLELEDGPASILVGGVDGEWREQHLGPISQLH